jgi:enoyl-CoA hydratase/carnithine racemase
LNKTKKAPLFSGAFLITARSYFFFVVVFVVLVVVVLEAVGVVVVVAVESIFIVVSIAAGAGAIAGADVSAVADSSFFAQAARTRTAATRARRFIYDLLWRLTWNKSPVRARDRGPVFGAGENLSLL